LRCVESRAARRIGPNVMTLCPKRISDLSDRFCFVLPDVQLAGAQLGRRSSAPLALSAPIGATGLRRVPRHSSSISQAAGRHLVGPATEQDRLHSTACRPALLFPALGGYILSRICPATCGCSTDLPCLDLRVHHALPTTVSGYVASARYLVSLPAGHMLCWGRAPWLCVRRAAPADYYCGFPKMETTYPTLTLHERMGRKYLTGNRRAPTKQPIFFRPSWMVR
jgi:hypothetical protein